MKIAVHNKKIDASLIPAQPGCYLMRNEHDEVIYVGKANILRSRVRSYFSKSVKYAKTIHLVSHIHTIEFFITENSLEALILENNLIKRHAPKYNVMLKDGKTYPYVKITMKEEFPRVFKTRKVISDGSRYFGPFPYEGRLNRMMKAIDKMFPIRKCRKMGKKVCLNFHIEKCLGPCEGLISQQQYMNLIDDVISLFKGNIKPVIDMLSEKMKHASHELRFEDAAEYRDHAISIKELFSKQNIEHTHSGVSEDIVVCAELENNVCCQVFFVREGKLVGKRHFSFSDIMISSQLDELYADFLCQFYENNMIPAEIITEKELAEELQQFLERKRGKRIKFTVAQRGRKRHLLNMARENAEAFLNINKAKAEKKKNILEKLHTHLELELFPQRIEVYDISNISGRSAVGSMIVIENGEFSKKEYRKFKIKTKDTPDDFAMLREVIDRRIKRIETSDWPSPDLMVIDGGKGQLSSVVRVLKKNKKYGDFDVISIAKREEEIFKPGRKDPFIIPKNSELFYFMQRIRDEAHRFAIGYFRKTHTNKSISSVLDDLKGIGDARRAKLLNYFGSVHKIAESDPHIVAKVCNISKKFAQEIIDFICEKTQ